MGIFITLLLLGAIVGYAGFNIYGMVKRAFKNEPSCGCSLMSEDSKSGSCQGCSSNCSTCSIKK